MRCQLHWAVGQHLIYRDIRHSKWKYQIQNGIPRFDTTHCGTRNFSNINRISKSVELGSYTSNKILFRDADVTRIASMRLFLIYCTPNMLFFFKFLQTSTFATYVSPCRLSSVISSSVTIILMVLSVLQFINIARAPLRLISYFNLKTTG